MRIRKIKVYAFNELKEEVKERVIENYRGDYDFEQESECLMETAHEIAKEYGFHDSEFNWSLTYSQGDGVSFVCSDINLKKLLKKARITKQFKPFLKLWSQDLLYLAVKRIDSHYYHKRTITLDYEIFDYDLKESEQALFNDFLKAITNIIYGICDRVEAEGYLAFGLNDETILDNFEANEYEFTANGEIFIG